MTDLNKLREVTEKSFAKDNRFDLSLVEAGADLVTRHPLVSSALAGSVVTGNLKFGLVAVFTTFATIKAVDLFTRVSATAYTLKAKARYHDRAINRLLSGNNIVEVAYEPDNAEVLSHARKAIEHREGYLTHVEAYDRLVARFR